MNQPVRNPYFDFLRGFAIIMVVGIHSAGSLSPTFTSFENICTILLRQILNCAVPLFLAISGYFIGAKEISWGKKHIFFLKKQIPKVYIPTLLLSLPFLIFSLISRENGLLKPLVNYFACGFGVFYFIALIIQYYLLLPIFMRLNNSRGIIFTSLISIVSVLVGIEYLSNFQGMQLPLLIYAAPFPLWIIFFFMGIYFSKHSRNYKIILPFGLILTGMALQIFEYKFWIDRGVFTLGQTLASFIFSAGVIWFFFSKKAESTYSLFTKNAIVNAVNWIGGISFGIYLLHIYIVLATHHLFPNFNWVETWTIVLCITILLIWIAKSLLPNFSAKYLGFR